MAMLDYQRVRSWNGNIWTFPKVEGGYPQSSKSILTFIVLGYPNFKKDPKWPTLSYAGGLLVHSFTWLVSSLKKSSTWGCALDCLQQRGWLSKVRVNMTKEGNVVQEHADNWAVPLATGPFSNHNHGLSSEYMLFWKCVWPAYQGLQILDNSG